MHIGHKLLSVIQPVHILFGILTYLLGAGIAQYLGNTFHWPAFWLGLLAILTLLIAPPMILEYFRLPFTPLAHDETIRQREQYRTILLQSSYAALSLYGITVFCLYFAKSINLSNGIFLILNLLIHFAYAVPPSHLADRGYGEILLAIFFGMLLPSTAFFLQTEEFHRMLPLITFPLTLLALACLLASNFPTFVSDQKLGRGSLLIRLTWQRAIPIHHVLIFSSFILFMAAPLVGVPWMLVWPVFLASPFAVFQVFWLQKIAIGGRTLWRFFLPLSRGVFGATAYLLALTFWIR
jgi:1,4-dihydroxy-2-naphthoate octaprenyltransferase